jgi:hypothetical protein
MFPAEAQLAAVVILIYLADGFLLLCLGEAVIECGRHRRILFGSERPWIVGRRILLLAPWRPLTTTWRVGWGVRDTLDAPDDAGDARARLAERARLIARLAPWVCTVWIFVLVAVPGSLLLAATPVFVLVAAIAWSSTWVLVLRLATLRRALGLSRGTFALIAFECLVCPPVAANLPRRVSLRLSPGTDLMAFVDADERVHVHGQLARDLETRLMFLETDSPAFARTRAYRDLLLGSLTPATDPES